MNTTQQANPQGPNDPNDPIPPVEPGITPDDSSGQQEEERPEDWRDPNDPGTEQPSNPHEGDPLNAPD